MDVNISPIAEDHSFTVSDGKTGKVYALKTLKEAAKVRAKFIKNFIGVGAKVTNHVLHKA